MTNRHSAFGVLAYCALCALASAQSPMAMMGSREQMLAAYERMPRGELEELFLRCDAESSQRPLGFSDGVICGMAWDTLLRQGFSGDVPSLLAWWRERRAPGPAAGKSSPP